MTNTITAQEAQDKMAETMREALASGKADTILFCITPNTARYSAFCGKIFGGGETIDEAISFIRDSRLEAIAELKRNAAVLGMVVTEAAE